MLKNINLKSKTNTTIIMKYEEQMTNQKLEKFCKDLHYIDMIF